MLELLIISFLIAFVAYTYSFILTAPDMILDFLYNWLSLKLEEKHTKIFYMLIGCFKCVAGQWSLWIYLILRFKEYNLIHHIIFIVVTIWFALIINKLYIWLTN